MTFPISRQEFPILDRITYLDTPYEGLIPQSDWNKVQELVDQDFATDLMRDKKWRYDLRDRTRVATSQALCIPIERAAVVTGFSMGLRQSLLHLVHKKKVILVEDDYPTLLDAFSTGAFEMHFIPRNANGSFSLDDLEFAMEKCRGGVFAFTHVYFATGLRMDVRRIAELAKEKEVTTVMDVTQSFASLPIDASTLGIDMLMASTYKWLSSGFGNGFVCLGNDRPDLLPIINQLNTGHLDPWAMLRMEFSLERLKQLDPQRIYAHIDSLNDRLVEGLCERGIQVLSDREKENRSAIVLFDGTEVKMEQLWAKGIRTSFRASGIRVGPHWYNTTADVDHLLAELS